MDKTEREDVKNLNLLLAIRNAHDHAAAAIAANWDSTRPVIAGGGIYSETGLTTALLLRMSHLAMSEQLTLELRKARGGGVNK